MLYLIWSLINIGVFVYFIAVCFKAVRLLRDAAGWLTVLVFVFGLLSFSGTDDDNVESGNKGSNSWRFAEENLRTSKHTIIVELQDNLVSEYDLGIVYEVGRSGNIPISGYSSTDGFSGGTVWVPVSINVVRTEDNNKFQYQVYGVVKWKLLGATVYNQSKTFQGFVSLNGNIPEVGLRLSR